MSGMVDLHASITLTSSGASIKLPLINILRISLVHLTELRMQYHQEKGAGSLDDFWDWVKEKLEMGKGKTVLL